VASLGVTIAAGTTQASALLPVLSATARGISRALGASSAQPPTRRRS
jgi:hypothetical protein